MSFDARSILTRLRDGGGLPEDAAQWLARGGLADGSVSDAQAGGAFAMAVCLKGLDMEERVGLTRAMRDSGQVLDWDLGGPVVDKHSTGGIGGFCLAFAGAALSACGVFVPMISGARVGPYRRDAG